MLLVVNRAITCLGLPSTVNHVHEHTSFDHNFQINKIPLHSVRSISSHFIFNFVKFPEFSVPADSHICVCVPVYAQENYPPQVFHTRHTNTSEMMSLTACHLFMQFMNACQLPGEYSAHACWMLKFAYMSFGQRLTFALVFCAEIFWRTVIIMIPMESRVPFNTLWLLFRILNRVRRVSTMRSDVPS